MTIERAHTIAKEHMEYSVGTVSYYTMENGKNLHVQTVYEPGYYDDSAMVCYIDTEDDNGDCMETHTAKHGDIDGIAFWIHELCYDTEES